MNNKSRCSERELAKMVHAGILELTADGRIFKPKPTRRRFERIKDGYYQVRMMVNGKRLSCYSHRIVWQVLFGNIPKGVSVNHKNKDRTDNRPENLELVSHRLNISHARGGYKKGNGKPSSKKCHLTDEDIMQIRIECFFYGNPISKVAAIYGVAPKTVRKIVKFETHTDVSGPAVINGTAMWVAGKCENILERGYAYPMDQPMITAKND